MPRSKSIRNLHTLEREILLQKQKVARIRSEMNGQMQHLKENAGTMAINSLAGGKLGQRYPLVTVLLAAVLRHEKVQSLLNRITDKLVGSVEKFMGNYSDSETQG
jgi:hypothetical protein